MSSGVSQQRRPGPLRRTGLEIITYGTKLTADVSASPYLLMFLIRPGVHQYAHQDLLHQTRSVLMTTQLSLRSIVSSGQETQMESVHSDVRHERPNWLADGRYESRGSAVYLVGKK